MLATPCCLPYVFQQKTRRNTQTFPNKLPIPSHWAMILKQWIFLAFIIDLVVMIDYSCNTMDDTPEEIQNQLTAEWQGYFFETLSVTEWTFYRLYMCKSRLTKEDGTIAIKERCEYDPDYYEYSWSQVTNNDKCTRQDLRATRWKVSYFRDVGRLWSRACNCGIFTSLQKSCLWSHASWEFIRHVGDF